jgi:hypothetical protein
VTQPGQAAPQLVIPFMIELIVSVKSFMDAVEESDMCMKGLGKKSLHFRSSIL